MENEKILTIGGKQVGFRATARMPRLYRQTTNHDIMRDLNQLQKSYQDAVKSGESIPIPDLEVFENAAYCMAKLYDPTIPNSPDEWLDTIEGTFDIYQILPEIMELWGLNQKTTSIPKNA